MNVSPAQAGFLKGLGLTVLLAIVSYFADASNIDGVLAPAISALVVSVASALESSMKAKSAGSKGLFGAVSIK